MRNDLEVFARETLVYGNGYEEAPIDMQKWDLLGFVLRKINNIQSHALKKGLLTRGCVTIGTIYHNANTWFGPGIIDAYEHGSEIAIYPRVILSDSAFEYFRHEILGNVDSAFIKDLDGYYFINFIKFSMHKFGGDFVSGHRALKDKIVSELEVHSGGRNNKALQKWRWLASWFNRCSDDDFRNKYGDDLSENIYL